MNKGFFASHQLERKLPLPPMLKVKVPTVENKEKQNPTHNSNIPQVVMDIECYSNYFLVKFLRLSDWQIFAFEMTEEEPLDKKGIRRMIRDYEVITFNGNHFDIPLLRYALKKDISLSDLKEAVNKLIDNNWPTFNFEELYTPLKLERLKHIDLIEIAPGMVSLKIYMGRLHCKRLQDLPIEPDVILTKKEMKLISSYCDNDLIGTARLYQELYEQVELRRTMSQQYGIDLMSKSDAQIAEAVISLEIEKIKGDKPSKPKLVKETFKYKIPEFIKFKNPKLNKVLGLLEENSFHTRSNGTIEMPEGLEELSIKIGSSDYRMGIGGLHSSEKTSYHIANDDYDYYDWDVTSYYPSIILNSRLYPKKIGPSFLKVYQKLVDERVEAKKNKDKVKADSFKILINGSYGKLGSPYSSLYAPELLIQVTLTGQLSLLMLIEILENRGYSVVSGNTDGIVIQCPRGKESGMRSTIKLWEKRTGFLMEEAHYAGIYSRDVNNYIAVKHNGEVKTKGCFASAGLAKNPEAEICSLAMIEYIKNGIPIEETIKNCKDITKFITVRSVKGGAVKNGQFLGKAIRWYYAKGEKGTINYKSNNNKVPATDGAKPIMELPDKFPEDVDYGWYINKCHKLFVTKKEK